MQSSYGVPEGQPQCKSSPLRKEVQDVAKEREKQISVRLWVCAGWKRARDTFACTLFLFLCVCVGMSALRCVCVCGPLGEMENVFLSFGCFL